MARRYTALAPSPPVPMGRSRMPLDLAADLG